MCSQFSVVPERRPEAGVSSKFLRPVTPGYPSGYGRWDPCVSCRGPADTRVLFVSCGYPARTSVLFASPAFSGIHPVPFYFIFASLGLRSTLFISFSFFQGTISTIYFLHLWGYLRPHLFPNYKKKSHGFAIVNDFNSLRFQ